MITPAVTTAINDSQVMDNTIQPQITSSPQSEEPPQQSSLIRSVADAVRNKLNRKSKPVPETTRQTRSMTKEQQMK
jgi:hypothetical protein